MLKIETESIFSRNHDLVKMIFYLFLSRFCFLASSLVCKLNSTIRKTFLMCLHNKKYYRYDATQYLVWEEFLGIALREIKLGVKEQGWEK